MAYDPNTIRILEIDGGGERGYMPVLFFKQFVELWGIQPEEVWKYFDVICGASVGSFISLGLASGKTADEMIPLFTTQGPYIFSLTSLVPSVRPNLAAKLALIAADIPFYQSSGPTADAYGSGLLYATVNDIFGTSTLQDLKTNVIVPAYQYDTQRYVLFSNLNYAQFIGQDELAANVGLASGAAPIYLPAVTFGGHTYLDGGIYQNNPAQFGVNLAKMIKPNADRICVLSLGTGIGEMGFDPGNPDFLDSRVPHAALLGETNLTLFNSVATIFSLFNIASTGGQESVAMNLFLQSNYTLDQFYYYRFQPFLPTDINTELDNTDPEILAFYEQTAEEVFENDIVNISAFLAHLTA